MFVRILSAIIGIPLLLFIVITGGTLLKLSVGIMACIGLNEFFNAFQNIGMKPLKKIGFISAVLLLLLTYRWTIVEIMMFWIFCSMLMVLVVNLFSCKVDVNDSAVTVLGIFYVVFFMFHIVFVSDITTYSYLIWMIFLSAFATDTFAYFTGYFFGSRKLCPTISPKKTVEGSIGGVVGSILSSAAFAYFFNIDLIVHCMIMGFVGSIFAQIGDLTASSFKRYVGIKDYGKIMPGHGGVLDRFDSILFTAPTVYYYILFFLVGLK
ncbi:phosphatidate cytidylyltransferase [Geosporobacter ferrireducens]|uniref:Phosphatidate cytidylyltransferase n=1 Tax=Geosporobacter ferrireducens TaxID=1424294 RepID=A0A1D8GBG2_9FIRM|nr:phosphatidate cytidylyltransferase [Geosporobacter ferrireducens]AOT68244.1 phosphatidate cytidylyltransferase [Geosporobacter ferrireducens]MTI57336.1 phosphatidate cytidylyltransferase [Geosporobacter ferrireducens]